MCMQHAITEHLPLAMVTLEQIQEPQLEHPGCLSVCLSILQTRVKHCWFPVTICGQVTTW